MRLPLLFSLSAVALLAQSDHAREFSTSIRPGLMENCAQCHNPAKAKGPAPFLKATTLDEMQANRGLWRNVAAQLRNRSMPPVASKLTEADRVHISSWIDARLHESACQVPQFAGS